MGGAGVVKVMIGNPTEKADLNSWEFMESAPTVRGPAWDQPMPLCMCVAVVQLGLFVRLLAAR